LYGGDQIYRVELLRLLQDGRRVISPFCEVTFHEGGNRAATAKRRVAEVIQLAENDFRLNQNPLEIYLSDEGMQTVQLPPGIIRFGSIPHKFDNFFKAISRPNAIINFQGRLIAVTPVRNAFNFRHFHFDNEPHRQKQLDSIDKFFDKFKTPKTSFAYMATTSLGLFANLKEAVTNERFNVASGIGRAHLRNQVLGVGIYDSLEALLQILDNAQTAIRLLYLPLTLPRAQILFDIAIILATVGFVGAVNYGLNLIAFTSRVSQL
jgi:hypothetical protein